MDSADVSFCIIAYRIRWCKGSSTYSMKIKMEKLTLKSLYKELANFLLRVINLPNWDLPSSNYYIIFINIIIVCFCHILVSVMQSSWNTPNIFRIYDMDNDGYISNGELFQVLKMMVGSNLKDTQLQQIVDKTILFADKVNLNITYQCPIAL